MNSISMELGIIIHMLRLPADHSVDSLYVSGLKPPNRISLTLYTIFQRTHPRRGLPYGVTETLFLLSCGKIMRK